MFLRKDLCFGQVLQRLAHVCEYDPSCLCMKFVSLSVHHLPAGNREIFCKSTVLISTFQIDIYGS